MNQVGNKAYQDNLEAKSQTRLDTKTYPGKTMVCKSLLTLDDSMRKEQESKTR